MSCIWHANSVIDLKFDWRILHSCKDGSSTIIVVHADSPSKLFVTLFNHLRLRLIPTNTEIKKPSISIFQKLISTIDLHKLIVLTIKWIITYLFSANSNADINVVSIYDIVPINDSINNWLMLECTNSSLNQTHPPPQPKNKIKKEMQF